MNGHITNININKNLINLNDEIINNLKKGEKLYPVKKYFKDKSIKFDIKISNNEELIKPYEVY